MKNWVHVVQIGLFIAGGIAAIALGQVAVGAALIGAAAGNAAPQSMFPSRKASDGAGQ